MNTFKTTTKIYFTRMHAIFNFFKIFRGHPQTRESDDEFNDRTLQNSLIQSCLIDLYL